MKKKRLEVVKGVLCKKNSNSTGKVIYQQAAVLAVCMTDTIWTLHAGIMQGHPGSKKMLYTIRRRYYCPNIGKNQSILNNYQVCIKSKPIAEPNLNPPTVEDLRTEQGTKRPVGNWDHFLFPTVSRTFSQQSTCQVHVYDSFEIIRCTTRCNLSNVDLQETRVCPEYQPDGLRHSLYC